MTRRNAWMVIAASAVLAAVIVTRTPGQVEYGSNGACCLSTGGCAEFSEASCNELGGIFLGGFTTCVGSTCPSVAPPTVVSVSVSKDTSTSTSFRVFRAWSDGQLDMTWIEYDGTMCSTNAICGPAVVIPGSCPTDIDRDGDTGIIDFLTLLGGWGACR